MAEEYVSIDISNAPELKRLAEAVRRSGKAYALKEGAETVAVVRPASKRERGAKSPRRSGAPKHGSAAAIDDPVLMKLIEEDLRANREAPVDRAALFAPPSPEEIARRTAVYDQIQARRHLRVIAPLTSADLVHEARAQEEEAYGWER